ncbi:MAG: hypothetical protein JWN06_1802 [Propionibacteriaceae bacterium]|nr:hypothetical protein [Propionibacteriaceae bacterium]
MFVEALGWAAAAWGASVALPQVVRLLRTRTTAGVSLISWQLAIGGNIAWTSHGFATGHANVWLPNLIMFCCSVTILLQMRRDRGVPLLSLFGPGLLLGLVTLGIDLTLGPVPFAIAAFLPSAFSQLAQLHDLVVAPNIRGVSLPFLIMNVFNQCLWFGWSMLASEISVTMCASALGAMMTTNMVWALLRRRGVVRARLAMMYA